MTNVAILANVAARAYVDNPRPTAVPADYEIVRQSPVDAQTGFQAIAYRTPAGELIIAFKGSDTPGCWTNTNAALARGQMPESIALATSFVESAREQFLQQTGSPPSTTVLTGHSKGGAEAQIVLAKLVAANASDYGDLQAVTFGAPGVSRVLKSDGIDLSANEALRGNLEGRALNVVHNGDIVGDTLTRTGFGRHVGRTEYVNSAPVATTAVDAGLDILKQLPVIPPQLRVLARVADWGYEGYKRHNVGLYIQKAETNASLGERGFGVSLAPGSTGGPGQVTSFAPQTYIGFDVNGNCCRPLISGQGLPWFLGRDELAG